ncbi:hypothetical protein HanRHA438_Chr11g0489771 [Helianthus annuus]|nr:hypothetical protein HanRHA438_Chr11g0489771 [Helianthus annuus]
MRERKKAEAVVNPPPCCSDDDGDGYVLAAGSSGVARVSFFRHDDDKQWLRLYCFRVWVVFGVSVRSWLNTVLLSSSQP